MRPQAVPPTRTAPTTASERPSAGYGARRRRRPRRYGLHFRPGQTTEPRLIQPVGDAPAWTSEATNEVVGLTMALTAMGGGAAAPLPVRRDEFGTLPLPKPAARPPRACFPLLPRAHRGDRRCG